MGKKINVESLSHEDSVKYLSKRMVDIKDENPTEAEYIGITLYNELIVLNKELTVDEDEEVDIFMNKEQFNLVLEYADKYQARFKSFMIKTITVSIVFIIALFVVQYFVVKTNLWMALLITAAMGLFEVYFVYKTLLPRFTKNETKRVKSDVSQDTLLIAQKVNSRTIHNNK